MAKKPPLKEPEIREVPIGDINPAPYNPRIDLTPTDGEYLALTRSLEEWGLVEPLVWNQRSGYLVGGHQRLKVLEAQGHQTVEVSVVDLDEPSEMALNKALNNIEGAWDLYKLSEILSHLDASGYDATLTGFDLESLEELLVDWQMPDGGPPNPSDYNPDEDLFLIRIERILGEDLDRLHLACQKAVDATGLDYQIELIGEQDQ